MVRLSIRSDRPLVRWFALAGVLLGLLLGRVHAAEPIVIGQSMPLGASDDGSSRRIAEGVRACVEAVNARGGINGRPLKVVTLDNAGNPAREAANIRNLVNEHKAVAILGCQGDALCKVAAATASELGVALVGPMAPAASLSRTSNGTVFRIRAGFDKEAAALARQLKSLAAFNVAIVSDAPRNAETIATLNDALVREKLTASVIAVDPTRKESFEAMLQTLGKGGFQAVVLDLGAPSVDTLIANAMPQRPEWPLVLAGTASGSLAATMSAFKGKIFGFTTVVPNPDASGLSLVRELQANVDKYAEGAGATYAGMEAYINTRVLVEALRRAGPAPQSSSVLNALGNLPDIDLGGFPISLRAGRASASDFVDIAVRSRTGALLK